MVTMANYNRNLYAKFTDWTVKHKWFLIESAETNMWMAFWQKMITSILLSRQRHELQRPASYENRARPTPMDPNHIQRRPASYGDRSNLLDTGHNFQGNK